MLATFMEVLDTSVANVSLPYIAGNLSASTDEATWVLTSYLVSNAIVLPATNWLGELFGRKRFLISCIILFTMKSLTHIGRSLLGLIFLVFGLNGFFHFIPMPPPSGVAGQFLGSMFATKYLLFVFVIQLIGGVLLLINRYVPLALTILAPSS